MMAHLNQAHPSDKTGNVSGKKTKVNQTKLTNSSAFVTAAAMSNDRKTILNDTLTKLLTESVTSQASRQHVIQGFHQAVRSEVCYMFIFI